MKEQLISLETARLAKEKGFDWPCDEVYATDGGVTENIVFASCNQFLNFTVVSAPTQSLLDKWLRDVHKTFVAIYPIQSWWEVDVRDCDMSKRVHSSPIKSNLALKDFRFNTYEQALEAGLQEALKLL